MNTSIFSVHRFNLVARKFFSENLRSLILQAIVCFVLLTTIFTIRDYWKCVDYESIIETSQTKQTGQDNIGEANTKYYQNISQEMKEEGIKRTNEKYADEIGIGIVIFFFLAAYFASGFGEYTQKKPERMAFLSQPATDFEKYLLRWLVYIPGFIVGYFLIFYMADLTRTLVCQTLFPALPNIYQINYSQLDRFFNLATDEKYLFALFFLFVQSVFLLGSVIWRNKKFLKTCFAIFIVFLAYLAFGCFWDAIHSLGTSQLVERDIILTHKQTMKDIVNTALTILTPLCWILTYFRMREMDIVHRLL